jgi:hypothetical protein
VPWKYFVLHFLRFLHFLLCYALFTWLVEQRCDAKQGKSKIYFALRFLATAGAGKSTWVHCLANSMSDGANRAMQVWCRCFGFMGRWNLCTLQVSIFFLDGVPETTDCYVHLDGHRTCRQQIGRGRIDSCSLHVHL